MAGDIVTVYGLLRQSDTVLLQKRQNTGFGDGFYSLIGGHVDAGENVREALLREAREEIGVSIPPDEAHFCLFLHRKTPKGVFLNFFFEVSNWRGIPAICEPHKASDLAFFNVQNLPENTLDYIQHAINCIQRGVREDYLGW